MLRSLGEYRLGNLILSTSNSTQWSPTWPIKRHLVAYRVLPEKFWQEKLQAPRKSEVLQLQFCLKMKSRGQTKSGNPEQGADLKDPLHHLW